MSNTVKGVHTAPASALVQAVAKIVMSLWSANHYNFRERSIDFSSFSFQFPAPVPGCFSFNAQNDRWWLYMVIVVVVVQ